MLLTFFKSCAFAVIPCSLSLSSTSQVSDTMFRSSWILPSFHNPGDSKRGQTETFVLCLSKTGRQNQANSLRLV